MEAYHCYLPAFSLSTSIPVVLFRKVILFAMRTADLKLWPKDAWFLGNPGQIPDSGVGGSSSGGGFCLPGFSAWAEHIN